ncbi:CbtB-domain containing protein [Mesorhizobium sp. M8A.F.Ca.ET.173.01.1.1]|nr:CbtB-domain containing protein [Mesorhizobium sp. M8A.F.Ca.ET.173.01.1.1]
MDSIFVPSPPITQPLPLSEVFPWGIFAIIALMITMYLVGAEQGAVSVIAGNGVHEFVHDARHLLGFPCH